MMPGLPLYPGTRPYQVLPFQWSCHTPDRAGGLHHREFLHEERSDPRRPFAEALLRTLDDDPGSILVYSSFERTRLNELADALPDLAGRIRRVQARLVDLMQIISAHVQHPDFHGSRSLKRVLPALVPDLSYEELEIQDGRIASNRYLAAILEARGTGEQRQTFAALRAYCTTDTLAMVRVFEELRLVAG